MDEYFFVVVVFFLSVDIFIVRHFICKEFDYFGILVIIKKNSIKITNLMFQSHKNY